MSELESIAKLREWSHRHDNGWIQKDGSIVIQADTHGVRYGDNYGEAIRSMIDEIEREVDERFMELPVDADGVPIHMGDMMKGVFETFEVCAVSEHYVYWADGRHWEEASECRHFKPVTAESMVLDVVSAFMGINAGQLNPDSESVAKCAKMLEEWKEGE